MANRIGVETISIPAISTGANNFPRIKCAEKMILRVA
jgi:O-acetyl-ADP-ribose deacetylase (regulator of RNase III)